MEEVELQEQIQEHKEEKPTTSMEAMHQTL